MCSVALSRAARRRNPHITLALLSLGEHVLSRAEQSKRGGEVGPEGGATRRQAVAIRSIRDIFGADQVFVRCGRSAPAKRAVHAKTWSFRAADDTWVPCMDAFL